MIFDDLDLQLGNIRIRLGGGDGGHNGIKSIKQSLSGQDFYRLRIGIGRPEEENRDVTSWVLGNFSTNEKEAVDQVLDKTRAALEVLLTKGLKSAQNEFN